MQRNIQTYVLIQQVYTNYAIRAKNNYKKCDQSHYIYIYHHPPNNVFELVCFDVRDAQKKKWGQARGENVMGRVRGENVMRGVCQARQRLHRTDLGDSARPRLHRIRFGILMHNFPVPHFDAAQFGFFQASDLKIKNVCCSRANGDYKTHEGACCHDVPGDKRGWQVAGAQPVGKQRRNGAEI